jgi:hypothetical protein|tara:strand:+ start:120 stop:479 length:360 start_codon:yes stop_codon:yes gene_type:complete
MSDKEVLVQNLREWMGLETEINTLRNKMKEIRTRKKEITENLVNFMKSKDIDCFDTNDGKIIYTQNKIKKPITGDLLLTTLLKYFKDDEQQANELHKFIMENRAINLKENLRLKPEKKN